MTRYAVYVITVEDTEANDLAIAGLYPEDMDRSAGNMDFDAAATAAAEAKQAAEIYDEGISK